MSYSYLMTSYVRLMNARILDEHRRTREKRKGDEALCMTKLDALRIILCKPSCHWVLLVGNKNFFFLCQSSDSFCVDIVYDGV